MWISGSQEKQESMKSGLYTDASVIKDIFALESKIVELGSGAGTGTVPTRGQQSGMSNSSSQGPVQTQQVSTSQLLSSFISTKQLIDTSISTAGPTPAAAGHRTGTGSSSGSGEANGADNNTGASRLVDNMPSVLGESYMFLSKVHLGHPFGSPKGSVVGARSIPLSSTGCPENRRSPTRTHSKRDSGDGGASSASVDQLLGTMRRLEQENSQLITRINELLELERKSQQKLRQIQEFKEDFASKYSKLKTVLMAYAKKYPHPDNPVVMAQQGGAQSDQVSITTNANVSSSGLAMRGSDEGIAVPESADVQAKVIKELEQTLRGALSRIGKLQKKAEEKDKVIADYESYYRRKKLERQKMGATTTATATATDGHSHSHSVGPSSSSSSPSSASVASVQYVNPDHRGSSVSGVGMAPRKNAATRTFEASLHRDQV